MGVFTTVGRNLIASAVQASGADCAIHYVAVSLGCGTLATALTAGTLYTALALDAGIPANLGSGVSLTITDGTNSQSVTTNSAALAGATSISVSGFTAAFNFAAHLAGVCPTPLVTDIALYGESVRLAANTGTAGAAAGESFTTGYYDGTQPTGIYLLVGYFGGVAASSTLGSGTLMGEDIQYWNHVLNNDSNMYQADSTV